MRYVGKRKKIKREFSFLARFCFWVEKCIKNDNLTTKCFKQNYEAKQRKRNGYLKTINEISNEKLYIKQSAL